jgi:hypothetical protein
MKTRMAQQGLQAAGIAAASRDRQAAIDAEQEGQVRGAILAGVPEELTKAAEQYSETGEVPQYQPGGYLGAMQRMPRGMRQRAASVGLPAYMQGTKNFQEAMAATLLNKANMSPRDRHEAETAIRGYYESRNKGVWGPEEDADIQEQMAVKLNEINQRVNLQPKGERDPMDGVDFWTDEATGQQWPVITDGKTGTRKVMPGSKPSGFSAEQIDKWTEQAYLYGGHDETTTDKYGKSTTVHVPPTDEEIDAHTIKRAKRQKRINELMFEEEKKSTPPAPSPEKVAAGTLPPSYVVNWKRVNEASGRERLGRLGWPTKEQGPYGEVGKELALLENEAQNAASPAALAAVKDKMLDLLDRLPEEAVTLGPGMTRTSYKAGEETHATTGGMAKDIAPPPSAPPQMQPKLISMETPQPHQQPYVVEGNKLWTYNPFSTPKEVSSGALSGKGTFEAGGVNRSLAMIEKDMENHKPVAVAEVGRFIKANTPRKSYGSTTEAIMAIPPERRQKVMDYKGELNRLLQNAVARGDARNEAKYRQLMEELAQWATQP